MTQEDKKLLLNDLCARLPYNVMVQPAGSAVAHKVIGYDKGLVWVDISVRYDLENVKLYLRSMSSMTDEESKEFGLLQTDFYTDGFLYPIAASNLINWLNIHHFDYLGLIERGLALEAPDGMYKN